MGLGGVPWVVRLETRIKVILKFSIRHCKNAREKEGQLLTSVHFLYEKVQFSCTKFCHLHSTLIDTVKNIKTNLNIGNTSAVTVFSSGAYVCCRQVCR